MNLRCFYCQTPFTLSQQEKLSALQKMQNENLQHYDAYCPNCRRANPVSRERLEIFTPGWQQALQQMQAQTPAPLAPSPREPAEEKKPEPMAPPAPRPAPMSMPAAPMAKPAPKPAPKPAAPKKKKAAPKKKAAKKAAPKKKAPAKKKASKAKKPAKKKAAKKKSRK